MALPDTFDKLKELLAQDQFEVLLDEENKEEKQEIRLVYLMNDAVERHRKRTHRHGRRSMYI